MPTYSNAFTFYQTSPMSMYLTIRATGVCILPKKPTCTFTHVSVFYDQSRTCIHSTKRAPCVGTLMHMYSTERVSCVDILPHKPNAYIFECTHTLPDEPYENVFYKTALCVKALPKMSNAKILMSCSIFALDIFDMSIFALDIFHL